MEYYKCSRCEHTKRETEFYLKSSKDGQLRPASLICKVCRSTTYFRKKGKEPTGDCKECGSPARVTKTELCRRCLKQRGLKECRACLEVKLLWEFYSKKAICKTCFSGQANSTAAKAGLPE